MHTLTYVIFTIQHTLDVVHKFLISHERWWYAGRTLLYAGTSISYVKAPSHYDV